MAAVTFSNRTRAYQQEMFERSMEGNRIIVMDTGSGKTQVAMLRIQAELNRCASEKRIWFLAPSIELCVQQHCVLQQAMPAYQMRLLTGQDNVDKWSEVKIWDAALDCARIVVSTHAILCDALRHGFVRLTSLALLVFDEAHHCVKKHPANVIMRDLYHEIKLTDADVPHILGLSASLIMSSSLKSVRTIESNLDSISVTPSLHREDLLRHVFRPECRILRYNTIDFANETPSEGLLALQRAIARHSVSCTTGTTLETSNHNETAQVQQALQKFYEKAHHVLVELGTYAADFFVHETMAYLRNKSTALQNLQLDVSDTAVKTLVSLFRDADVEQCYHRERTTPKRVSAKVRCLVDYLLQIPGPDFCGIVFVNQRIVASVLSSLLNDHPSTKGRLRCVPSVGMSNFSGRKFTITELIDRRIQKQALAAFRQGQANIIIATSVLEEGIDVQACNVVACFDLPANLKSFIQRRGRARHQRSHYGMLLEANADHSKLDRWHNLEKELTALCQQERQQVEVVRCIEAEDEPMEYVLRVASTGARLDADSTLQHLNHFCQLLQRDPCIDRRPEFVFHDNKYGQISARVTLPQCVPAHVRQASSERTWRTERAAMKDAAFHAYAALFEAGLLNSYLLPITQEWSVNEGLDETVPPARLQIESLNLWAPSHGDQGFHKLKIEVVPTSTLSSGHDPPIQMFLNTYRRLSTPPVLHLHWDGPLAFEAHFTRPIASWKPTAPDLCLMHRFTCALYRAPRSNRHWHVEDELLAVLEPSVKETWFLNHTERPANTHRGQHVDALVRIRSRSDTPYLFRDWTQNGEVVCTRLPRKRNFTIVTPSKLVREQATTPNLADPEHLREEVFSEHDCTIGSVTVAWARFGLFMPSVFQHILDFTVVDDMNANLLYDLKLSNRDYLRTAITTPSAQRISNYQRFEFLGDCVLKYLTSCHLFSAYPNWPEGYLSQRRSLLVSNSTLACAAIRRGLPRYIISEPVDHRHWTLPSTDTPRESREVSSKTVADVVEALIGAAWLEAGIEAARHCVNVFLPTMPRNVQPHISLSAGRPLSGKRKQIEFLIGYTFSDSTLLLQALTHPSYAQVSKTDSYERLEFLGDAVLDLLVAELLAEHIDRLTQGRMTQMKSSLVNANLLGFLCFNLRYNETHRVISTDPNDMRPREGVETHEYSLADCLQFHSEMAAIHRENRARYQDLQQAIQQELEHGTSHPWATLEQLAINKMFSDMVESILGAIFLDSQQELAPCRSFLEHLGLRRYAIRVIREQVDVKPFQAQSVVAQA